MDEAAKYGVGTWMYFKDVKRIGLCFGIMSCVAAPAIPNPQTTPAGHSGWPFVGPVATGPLIYSFFAYITIMT